MCSQEQGENNTQPETSSSVASNVMPPKVTPGPWTVNPQGYLEAYSPRHGQSTHTVLIARMEKHRLGSADRVCPDDIQEANACLIAAAPELLEVLTRTRWHLMTKARKDPEERQIVDQITEAIAKATEIQPQERDMTQEEFDAEEQTDLQLAERKIDRLLAAGDALVNKMESAVGQNQPVNVWEEAKNL